MDNKIPFGLNPDTNRLIHIEEAERGQNCGCICPHCRLPLVARKGEVREHYFAHKAGVCPHAHETAIHYYIKEVIEKHKLIVLPKRDILLDSCKAKIEKVEIETRYGEVVPDIVIWVSGKPIFVEVCVTHPVDENKLDKIKKMAVDTVEIDIRKSKAHIDFYNFDKRKVENLVIHTVIFKKWLYTDEMEKRQAHEEMIEKQERERKEKLEEERKKEEQRKRVDRCKKSYPVTQKIAAFDDLIKGIQKKYNCVIFTPGVCSCGGLKEVVINHKYKNLWHLCNNHMCREKKLIGKYMPVKEMITDYKAGSYTFVTRHNVFYSFCPICNSQLQFRYSKSNDRVFLGCYQFPKCKGTKRIVVMNNVEKVTRENLEEEIKKLL